MNQFKKSNPKENIRKYFFYINPYVKKETLHYFIEALLYSYHCVFRRSIIPYVYLSKVNLKYFVC